MKSKSILILGLLIIALALTNCSPNRLGLNTDGETAGGTSTDDSGTIISGEATVNQVDILIMESFPVQAMAVVQGTLPDGCTAISGSEESFDGNHTIHVQLTTSRSTGVGCTEAEVHFEENIPLDVLGLPAGEYTVDVNGVTATFTLSMDNSPPVDSPPSDSGAGICPRGGEGTALFTNETDGFCFLFPDHFTMRDDEAPGVAGFYGPPHDETLEPVRAILYVIVEPAGGRALEQIAEESRARYEGTGVELIITDTTLDGKPAIMIEGEGEMARTLRIVTIYNNTLYAISVSPYDEAFPQAVEDVALVWDMVTQSFTFIQ